MEEKVMYEKIQAIPSLRKIFILYILPTPYKTLAWMMNVVELKALNLLEK